MTTPVVSVTPTTMLEEAANLLVKHKIGGLPVVDRGKPVGIITATDLLRAFVEVLGTTVEGVARIFLSLKGDSSELATIAQLVAQENGEILDWAHIGASQRKAEAGWLICVCAWLMQVEWLGC